MSEEVQRYYVTTKGLDLQVDTGIDLSDATSILLDVQKPNGDTLTWTAEMLPDKGPTWCHYMLVENDWDQFGLYSLHAIVKKGTSFSIPGIESLFFIDKLHPRKK